MLARRSLTLVSCQRWRSVRVKITDENGSQIYSNWPRPFGAGVYKEGEKAGFPIMEDSWQLGCKRNTGRVTTFRTTHRWPRPTEMMPLRKKLDAPPKWEDAYQSFASFNDPIAFPKPGEAKPVPEFQYFTEEPKEITVEAVVSDEEQEQAPLAKKDFPEEKCPLASRGISVTPKDVLILRQFCKKDGTMLTQEQTGLCDRQHQVVREALTIAQNDGLMPYSSQIYMENRWRWRIHMVDEPNEVRTVDGWPIPQEITNRHNSRIRPGYSKGYPSKGYPWWRLYTQSYSEVLAEETPRGLPKERTQRISTSKCLNDIFPTRLPSFWDNWGMVARKNRLGPFNHCN